MRTVRTALVVCLLGVSCSGSKSKGQDDNDDNDDRTDGDDDDDDDDDGGGFGSGGPGEGEGEGEGEEDGGGSGDGNIGEPASGEVFQFIVERVCDYRWDLDGEVAACLECELAFDLSLELTDAGSCAGGVDGSGKLRVTDSGVYFEGAYWGSVFAVGDGYLTWNTTGYVYGAETYYYLGHLTY